MWLKNVSIKVQHKFLRNRTFALVISAQLGPSAEGFTPTVTQHLPLSKTSQLIWPFLCSVSNVNVLPHAKQLALDPLWMLSLSALNICITNAGWVLISLVFLNISGSNMGCVSQQHGGWWGCRFWTVETFNFCPTPDVASAGHSSVQEDQNNNKKRSLLSFWSSFLLQLKKNLLQNSIIFLGENCLGPERLCAAFTDWWENSRFGKATQAVTVNTRAVRCYTVKTKHVVWWRSEELKDYGSFLQSESDTKFVNVKLRLRCASGITH